MENSKRHLTALAFMLNASGGRTRISVQNIRKDRKLGASLSEITVDPVTGSLLDGSLGKVLSAIRGGALGHYHQPKIPEIINQALTGQGLLPLDNPIRDFSSLVSDHLSDRFDQDIPSLTSIARRHGIPSAEILLLQEDPSAGLELMALLYRESWARLSGFSPATQEETGPFDTSKYDAFIAPSEPLPAPNLPQMSEPFGGWRKSPWENGERHAVARDFCSGVALEVLSNTYFRSPRAILSRLMIDGLIQK